MKIIITIDKALSGLFIYEVRIGATFLTNDHGYPTAKAARKKATEVVLRLLEQENNGNGHIELCARRAVG